MNNGVNCMMHNLCVLDLYPVNRLWRSGGTSQLCVPPLTLLFAIILQWDTANQKPTISYSNYHSTPHVSQHRTLGCNDTVHGNNSTAHIFVNL